MKKNTFLRLSFLSLVFGFLSLTGDATNLYWVGGSGDWHNANHWSLISGGKGGATLPNINDDVIFDENSFTSNNENVMLSGNMECRNISWSPNIPKSIVSGSSSSTLNIYGSLLLTSQINWNYSGDIHFKSSITGNTVNTYGKQLAGNVSFEGSGSWILNGSLLLSTSSTLTFSSGSLISNSNAIQCGTLKVEGSSQKLIDITHSILAIKQSYSDIGAGNFHSNTTGAKIYLQHSLPVNSFTDIQRHLNGHALAPRFTPAVISVDSVITDPTCNAADTGLSCNGSIVITHINATDAGPFSISWAGPNQIDTVTGFSAFNLCPNTYSYTIYDSASQTVYGPIFVTVTAPPPLTTNYIKRNVTCNGSCNGWIITRISGETPNYTYAWSNGPTGSAVGNPSNSFYDSSLCAGTYSIRIIDSRGCRNTFKTTVTQPLPVTISFNPTNVTCNGSCNGSVIATASGGHGQYKYTWAPGGQTTSTITGLCAGTYTLTAKDDSGCIGINNVTITQPTPIVITTTQSNVTCNGNCNGTATATVTGGTPAYTYKWSPSGGTNATASGLCAGVYKIVVTDFHGCKDSANVTITQPLNLNLTVTQTNISCNGNCNGTASVTATGGTPAYTYSWSNGGTNTSISSLCAGSYTIIVTDSHGCKDTANVTITQPLALAIATTQTNLTCNGTCNGTATATVTGGSPAYTYSWSNGATTATATSLCAGSYKVVVTDSHGCKDSTNVTITQPAGMTLTTTNTNVTCMANCIGTATISVSGGNVPYTYHWSNGATTTNVSGLCAGIYKIVVTDAKGCKDSTNVTITQPNPLILTFTQTNIKCKGDCNGSSTVTVSGGTTPYAYAWSPSGGTNATASGLCAGVYKIVVTDANGCKDSLNVTITQPVNSISVTTSQTAITCNGTCNGSATANPSGGAPPYTYSWSNGGTNATISSLCAGSYSVVVTDANGCKDSTNITVTQPASMILTITQNNISCFGDCNGTASVTVSGGNAPYTYKWNTGATTTSIAGLCSGTTRIVVTDSHGCKDSADVITTEPTALIATMSQSNVTCNGSCNGVATATVSGGTPAYTYSWSNGDTTATVSGLCAGNYKFVVTDNHGCADTLMVTITQPSAISITTTQTNISCNGNCNGTINTTVSGGTPAYVYSWSNGATTANLSSLCSGSFRLIVTDSHGCIDSVSITITQPTALVVTTTQTNESCNGNCNGTASATVSGGTPAYTYSWSNGATTTSINNLCAGNYEIVITDGNGCKDSVRINITQPNALSISTSQVNVSCNGDCNGQATGSVGGGTAPYTYSWTPSGGTNGTATGLCPGTYTITVTDNNNCSDTASVTITQPTTALSASITSSVNVTCTGNCNGTATVSASGGTAPYTYSWSPSGGTNSTATGLCAGSYTVTVTDNNGCTAIATVTISQQHTALIASLTSSTNVSCNGSCDGTATVSANGGTAPYTYSWSPSGGTNASAANLCANTYTVTVTDNNGCTASVMVTITQPAAITITTSQTNATCNGSCNGTATANASGGTAPYTYTWSNSATGQSVSGLCAGSYTVTVSDNSGCSQTMALNITAPAPLTISVSANTIQCHNTCDGIAIVNVTGGTSPYIYTVSSPSSTNTYYNDTLTSLCPGVTYTIVVEDSNRCTIIDSVNFINPAGMSVSNTITASTCNSTNNGAITVSVSGGAAPYTYSWSNGSTNQNQSNILSGTYTLTVTDASGCIITDTVVVTSLQTVIAIGGNDTSICAHNTVILNGDSSINALTYQWFQMPGMNPISDTITVIVNPSVTTSYILVVSNGGCTDTSTIIVTINPALAVDAGAAQSIIPNQSVTIGGNPTAPSGSTYFWEPNTSLNDSTSSNPVATPTVTTTYTVYADNPDGCPGSDTVTVFVVPQIVIPDGFSPNGDGQNDVWNIGYIYNFPNVVVEVYNRWGELLFRSIGYSTPWDGTYTGKPVPIGTYYYIINLHDSRYTQNYTGPVTILR